MNSTQYQWTKAFAAYYGVEPPWDCFFCEHPILRLGRYHDSLNRHHLDGDDQNNARENLVPAHHDCHSSHTKSSIGNSSSERTVINGLG